MTTKFNYIDSVELLKLFNENKYNTFSCEKVFIKKLLLDFVF